MTGVSPTIFLPSEKEKNLPPVKVPCHVIFMGPPSPSVGGGGCLWLEPCHVSSLPSYDDSSANEFLNSSIKYDYLLWSEVKQGPLGEIGGICLLIRP
jgi:hypothetical protein